MRAAIQKGDTNLRDRLHIKLENDLRYGEVRFDDWMMYAKVVDLPTIIESLKTIDNKSFYKTADICHMMICKFEQDAPQPEEESPNKAKKKDPNKVDKKYLWPHGITPPCKNVRKRRFRKTLKKKYVEAPEIEREVKRLLRIDNDAVHVKYEIINEEEDDTKAGGSGMNQNGDKGTDRKDGGKGFGKNAQKNRESANSESNLNNSRDVGEHEIFGDVSSSDDDDEGDMYKTEMDDHSQMSADDSRMSGSNDFKVGGVSSRPSNFYRVDRQDSDNEGEFKVSSTLLDLYMRRCINGYNIHFLIFLLLILIL